MRAALVASLLALAAFGCRAERRGEGGASSSSSAVRKVADATVAGAGGTHFDVDPATGHAKSSLILRLDYFPSVQPGAATLPACLSPLPAGFVLGVVACLSPSGPEHPLTAGNVEQDCYTGTDSPRVPAASPLTLPGCTSGVAALSTFDPPLQLDVEASAVN